MMRTWIICVFWIVTPAALVLGQDSLGEPCRKLVGPLTVPRYPFLGRGGYGAEFELRYRVQGGKVQEIEVREAWMNTSGKRWQGKADTETDPSRAFLETIREALSQWKFSDQAPCRGRLWILFTVKWDDGSYTAYRTEGYPDSVPDKILIELHQLTQLEFESSSIGNREP